jgi:hypothetical protein
MYKIILIRLKNDFYNYYSKAITTVRNRGSDCVVIYIFGIIENALHRP